MSIIKDLKNENDDYTIINSTAEDCLNDLSKINIFVGANNTGKSRFMRSLYKTSPLFFLPHDEQFDLFLSKIRDLNKPEGLYYDANMDRQNAKKNIYNKLYHMIDDDFFVEESKTPCPQFISLYNEYKNYKGNPNYYVELIEKYFEKIPNNLFQYDFYRIYIPSLRGLIPLITSELKSNEQNNDVYAKRINKDYFYNEKNIIFNADDMEKNIIISGLQFYEYITNYLLGDLKQRELIKKYETYLSNEFFEGKEVALIPKVKDDILTVKIGNEEQPIYNLGEGIQSIILITLPLFSYLNLSKEDNTNVLVFIEEPETGLHPKLQRKLIKTLLDERFDNFQFFFTTHSNHFLDRQFENEDISIYSFDKNSNSDDELSFSIEKVDFNHLPTLNKLGALPSSVLMQNCTILVEGSYDIKYYDLYLKLYQEKLKNEDPDVTLLEKGTHYSFLRGGGTELLNTVEEFNSIEKERIYTILDFDNEEKSKQIRNFFKEINYTNYQILDVKEVENLISKDVLLKILNSFREIRELKIKHDFDEKKYQKSNFYNFIVNNILDNEIPDNFFKEDTLKRKFSDKVKKFTNNYDDLSDPAKKVVENIYGFILNHNNEGFNEN